MVHSIELAQNSRMFRQIIVSTDDKDIARIALDHDADVHHRPPELREDHPGTQAVVGAALKDLGVEDDMLVCALYATCPLLTMEDLLDGNWLVRQDEVLCTYSLEPDCEDPSGGFYFAPAWFFMQERDPYEEGIGILTSDIDINDMVDWTLAEKIYEERYNEPNQQRKN